jgi:type III restriction enzyme
MSAPFVNVSALEPLFAPHEEPNLHRVRARKPGDPAQVVKGRRPTGILVAQNLRGFVSEWRENDYPGASDTTRELLHHWFLRDHTVETPTGERVPFRYYFCQREAIETLIYLHEVRGLTTLSGVVAEFGGPDSETAALGVDPKQDRWARYAFKVATGAGKTKVMSLAVAWSYFHALRESESSMARHFVVVAPNLTVFERLKEDFANGRIFDTDPLIPVAWRGDWNLSVVLQDETSGAATGGTLYLTNIHRLHDPGKLSATREAETYPWMGPPVSKAKALDTGEALRARVTSHPRVMVMNDEAHHVWEPGSAWNEAIEHTHEIIAQRSGGGLVAQLDFSATPKDNHGNVFQHVICDTPLGEAVDGGIVKTPIIGRTRKLVDRPSDDASERYQQHLMLGYQCWLKSKEEWEGSGMKPLLFVMAEDTEAADQMARRLNGDPLFQELNGKTVNLHTNLKGKIKWIGGKKNGYPEFVESEKEISEEDLVALRTLSRELDSNRSPYRCIVSVLMLREGWDVRNVTTIVPLRPYSSKARILPEQTLGRGLRRMTPPGQANEMVTCVEHPAFVSLYEQELAQEGVPVAVVDVEDVPKTTVTIFPDERDKDLAALDLLIPPLTPGVRRTPRLEDLAIDDVKQRFTGFERLPLGGAQPADLDYEGRHLITNEIVQQMTVHLPLLENGVGAVSFFREELERLCSLRGTHAVLAPLIETFLTEILFKEQVTLFDDRLTSRLADDDVRQHVRAVFVPLIRDRTTLVEERTREGEPVSVCTWKPFQVTHSETHPALAATRTPFNLVPCDRHLEVIMTPFLDHAPEVAAFCKNAGPQALRIDYLARNQQLSLYAPDFLVRRKDGHYVLVETKGRADLDVPRKAAAAAAWCKAASTRKVKWEYLYVPQGIFEGFASNSLDQLMRTCAPELASLLKETTEDQLVLPFAEGGPRREDVEAFLDAAVLAALPSRYANAVEQAATLFHFLEQKEGMSFAPVFTPLLGPLDEAAKGLILDSLLPAMPEARDEQRVFFEPDYGDLSEGQAKRLRSLADNLRRTLVNRNGLMPVGLLRSCLDHAKNYRAEVGGVFAAVKTRFAPLSELLPAVDAVYRFRNTYIAHQDEELYDEEVAREELRTWVNGLAALHRTHQRLGA